MSSGGLLSQEMVLIITLNKLHQLNLEHHYNYVGLVLIKYKKDIIRGTKYFLYLNSHHSSPKIER